MNARIGRHADIRLPFLFFIIMMIFSGFGSNDSSDGTGSSPGNSSNNRGGGCATSTGTTIVGGACVAKLLKGGCSKTTVSTISKYGASGIKYGASGIKYVASGIKSVASGIKSVPSIIAKIISGGTTAATGTYSSSLALKSAGSQFLKTTNSTTLSLMTGLLDDVPALKTALKKGMPMEDILKSSSICKDVGKYLLKNDRKVFITHFNNSLSFVEKGSVERTIAKEQIEKKATDSIEDLVGKLQNNSKISREIIRRELSSLAPSYYDDVVMNLSSEGLYVDIKVNSKSLSLSMRVDLSDYAVKGTGAGVTYKIIEKSFSSNQDIDQNE